MIDFIKIYYRDKTAFEAYILQEGNFYNVYNSYEVHTSEILYPLRAKYKGMDYVVSEKRGYIKNSLHKFYNIITSGEDQNYNDFTYSKLCFSIDKLLRKMVDVHNTNITQLEFGLNICTPIPAEDIIRKNIIMHNLKGFNHNRWYYGKGELKQFDHYNYFIKVYDKAKQFNLNQNVLRFELKFIKAKEFQKAGIYNLLDLKDKSNLRRLFVILLERFDKLTIVDDVTSTIQLNNKDKHNFIKYLNPRFWEGLSEENKRQIKSVDKNNFKRILKDCDLTKTKQVLRGLLIEKFNYLMEH